MRCLLALVLFALAPLAQAQTDDVYGEIIDTRDAVIGDGEILDDRSVRDQIFYEDDIVSDLPSPELMAAARSGADRLANSRAYRLMAASRQPQVRYRVRGEHAGAATPLLVRVAETDALRSLRTHGAPDGRTLVDATFAFETVAEWAAWTERSTTRALLDELSDGLRTDLDVTR